MDPCVSYSPEANVECDASQISWTVVIPFFNERDWLPETIVSLAGQTAGFNLILVDNGSTDGSAAIARDTCARHRLHYVLIDQPQRGKVAALATGLSAVTTPYVATCDADTWYPPDYLRTATTLLLKSGTVAAGAFFVPRHASALRRWLEGIHIVCAGKVFSRQCHAGGAGQVFDMAALRRAGSYDQRLWNFVLEDHEIMQRLQAYGRIEYSRQFWSAPSTRVRDRNHVSWTLLERVIYHAVGGFAGGWYFSRFLAPRLRTRKLSSERLRERVHVLPEKTDATPYLVR